MAIDRICIHESVERVFPPARLQATLRDAGIEVIVSDDAPDTPCDAVVTFDHRDWFFDAQWVHSILTGVDRYPIDAYADAGVILTSSTGIHGDAVGQSVLGYMLSIARDLHRYRDHQRERTWHQHSCDEMLRLDGESLCIVGLGVLGSGIARYAGAIGMSLTGVRRSGSPTEEVETVYTPDQLHTAIEDAKFVALAVPLMDETEGLIDAAAFERMRDDAYLINVARGPVVDEAALIDALESGEIAGAALDVYDTEPLPESSPLWGMENVLMTPHVSALFPSYHESVGEIVIENIDRLKRGDELINRVR